jgi:hypothetical protein
MGGGSVTAFRGEGVGAMDHQLGLVIIFLLVVGMMVASWIAVRCGIRAPIEKERGNGKEG